MSSDVRFTPLYPLEYDGHVSTSRNAHGAGIRIHDPAELRSELTDTLANQMDTRTSIDGEDYPRQEWDLLLGFTTWGRGSDPMTDDLGTADFHNVANTDPEDFCSVWETVSEYTDAFFVYMTTFEGHWPHPVEIARHGAEIYYAEADDGRVTLERLELGLESRTVERGETADA